LKKLDEKKQAEVELTDLGRGLRRESLAPENSPLSPLPLRHSISTDYDVDTIREIRVMDVVDILRSFLPDKTEVLQADVGSELKRLFPEVFRKGVLASIIRDAVSRGLVVSGQSKTNVPTLQLTDLGRGLRRESKTSTDHKESMNLTPDLIIAALRPTNMTAIPFNEVYHLIHFQLNGEVRFPEDKVFVALENCANEGLLLMHQVGDELLFSLTALAMSSCNPQIFPLERFVVSQSFKPSDFDDELEDEIINFDNLTEKC